MRRAQAFVGDYNAIQSSTVQVSFGVRQDQGAAGTHVSEQLRMWFVQPSVVTLGRRVAVREHSPENLRHIRTSARPTSFIRIRLKVIRICNAHLNSAQSSSINLDKAIFI